MRSTHLAMLELCVASTLGFGLSTTAHADTTTPAQVVVQSSTFGLVSLPFTTNFGATLQPLASPYSSSDLFRSDYGFKIAANGSFNSALVTFDLGDILNLSDVKFEVMKTTPWAGAVPTALTAMQIAQRDNSSLAWSSGTTTYQAINAMTLPEGDYTLEVQGHIVGSYGGSYGGVLNIGAVSPVPETSGVVMVLAGLGLLAWTGRRAKR